MLPAYPRNTAGDQFFRELPSKKMDAEAKGRLAGFSGYLCQSTARRCSMARRCRRGACGIVDENRRLHSQSVLSRSPPALPSDS